MTQHLQSRVKSVNVSLIKPTETKASQNHTCGPIKEPLSPERPIIATLIYTVVIRLSRETAWCWCHKEDHLMLQHIRLMRKPMWLQTGILLAAQLYAMICLLSVGFGRRWKVEKQSQRSSVTKKPKVKLPIKHIAVKLKL